jgi:general secretion pathway protein A
MYQEYYGLQDNPFSLAADAKYLYWSQTHQNAFRHLLYSIQSNKSFSILAGDVGTGKTTLLHVLLEWLKTSTPQTNSAYVVHSTLGVEDLLRYIVYELGIEPEASSKIECILALKRFALRCADRGERLLLIFDEAQNYTYEVLEELRLLSNIETPNEKLLHIIFAGQPHLIKNINKPEMYQLKQRVSAIYNLRPLSHRETPTYIQKRLDIAGAQGRSFFDDDAIEAIHQYAHGIPRVINVICDHALLYNFAENKKRVSTKIVRAVAADMGLRREAIQPSTDDAPDPAEDDIAGNEDQADSIIIGHAREALERNREAMPAAEQPAESTTDGLDTGHAREALERNREAMPAAEQPAESTADGLNTGHVRETLERNREEISADDQTSERTADADWLFPQRERPKNRKKILLLLGGMTLLLLMLVAWTSFIHLIPLGSQKLQQINKLINSKYHLLFDDSSGTEKYNYDSSGTEKYNYDVGINNDEIQKNASIDDENHNNDDRNFNMDINNNEIQENTPIKKENKFTIVKEGDSFEKILLEAYGRYDQSIVSLVLKANPEIYDIDTIFVGQRIRLPEP